MEAEVQERKYMKKRGSGNNGNRNDGRRVKESFICGGSFTHGLAFWQTTIYYYYNIG